MNSYGRLARGAADARLWLSQSSSRRQPRALVRRGPGGSIIFVIVLGAILGVVAIGAAVFFFKKRKQKKTAEYQRTWGDDTVVDARQDGHALNTSGAGQTTTTATSQIRNASSDPNAPPAAGASVDRNTSVRSVMTLPAYRQSAAQNEQVLGREGERDGIDVIVDLPTEEEAEAMRDEEMETMYQIRVARRQQIEEQQQRRVERREARQRGDGVALVQIRARAERAANTSTIEDLRREMERAKENRKRSVSSVSYADLGVARHDGTRIRGSSNDSERMGLLSDAASMAASAQSSARSPLMHHHRERSASSVLSIDSSFPSPGFTRSRGNSQSDTPRISVSEARAGSSPELVEADLGDESMPPPGYEDVSLADDNEESGDRSTTPMHEPPPDYPGPYRTTSQRSQASHRSQRSQRSQRSLTPTSSSSPTSSEQEEAGENTPRGSARGVGGIPQLPSLRISRLPEIVVQPSSALPRDDESDQRL